MPKAKTSTAGQTGVVGAGTPHAAGQTLAAGPVPIVEQPSLAAPPGAFLGGLIPQGADFTAGIFDAILGVPKNPSETAGQSGTERLGNSIKSLLNPTSDHNLLDLATDMINPSTGEMDYAGLLPGIRDQRRAARQTKTQTVKDKEQQQQIRTLQIEKYRQQVTGTYQRRQAEQRREDSIFNRVFAHKLKEAGAASEAKGYEKGGLFAPAEPLGPLDFAQAGRAARAAAVGIVGKPTPKNYQVFNQVQDEFKKIIKNRPDERVDIPLAQMAAGVNTIGPHEALAFGRGEVEMIGTKVANPREVAQAILQRKVLIDRMENAKLVDEIGPETMQEVIKAAGINLADPGLIAALKELAPEYE